MKFLIVFFIFVSQIKAQKEISIDLSTAFAIYPHQIIESDINPSRTNYAKGRGLGLKLNYKANKSTFFFSFGASMQRVKHHITMRNATFFEKPQKIISYYTHYFDLSLQAGKCFKLTEKLRLNAYAGISCSKQGRISNANLKLYPLKRNFYTDTVFLQGKNQTYVLDYGKYTNYVSIYQYFWAMDMGVSVEYFINKYISVQGILHLRNSFNTMFTNTFIYIYLDPITLQADETSEYMGFNNTFTGSKLALNLGLRFYFQN